MKFKNFVADMSVALGVTVADLKAGFDAFSRDINFNVEETVVC